MNTSKSIVLGAVIVCLLLCAAEATPRRSHYNSYQAGAAGGGYAKASGGSFGHSKHGRPGGYHGPPGGGYSSGHSSGGFQAKGGFVAGGGSVSGGYNKGYTSGHRG